MKKTNGQDCWVGVDQGSNPKDSKAHWWKWEQCKTTNAGNFNAGFSGTGSGCSAGRNYTVQNTTPVNLTVAGVPTCSNNGYNVTLNWTNTNNVLLLDISSNSFASYSNKNVGNQTSTSAPTGFSNSLTLNPGTTYYWRLWNGSVHTTGPSFSAPSCVPPTPTITTPACIWNGDNGPGINISWALANPAITYVDISPNNFTTSFYNKAVTGTSTTGSGFSSGLTFNAGTPYYVRTWNGYAHNNAPNPSFSIPLCVPAAPTGLSSSCPVPGNSAALAWTPVTGATSYQITVNGTPTTSSASPISYPATSGDSYSWGVSACNSAGCSTATAGTGFTCLPPACPGGLGACGDYLPTPNTIGVCSGGAWQHNAGLAGVPGAELGYNAWCAKNANPTRGFCYQCNTAATPWIQVTGDVHSNTRINAPGGPR